ncbi:WG repeat-containing protein [Cohnella hashimotonis]
MDKSGAWKIKPRYEEAKSFERRIDACQIEWQRQASRKTVRGQ